MVLAAIPSGRPAEPIDTELVWVVVSGLQPLLVESDKDEETAVTGAREQADVLASIPLRVTLANRRVYGLPAVAGVQGEREAADQPLAPGASRNATCSRWRDRTLSRRSAIGPEARRRP